jgi:hypothetical protein
MNRIDGEEYQEGIMGQVFLPAYSGMTYAQAY